MGKAIEPLLLERRVPRQIQHSLTEDHADDECARERRKNSDPRGARAVQEYACVQNEDNRDCREHRRQGKPDDRFRRGQTVLCKSAF